MSNIGNKEIFSLNLKYYMDKTNITQKELAEIVGVATSTFNDWIKAKKYPRMDKIELLKLYNESLKTGVINQSIIKYIIDYEIEKNNYQNYINEISFFEICDGCGFYNPSMKKMYVKIDLDDILSPSIEILMQAKYSVILEIIYHELTHVEQYKSYVEYLEKYKRKFPKKYIDKVLRAKIYEVETSIQNNEDLYLKNHDYFSCEHEAIFNAVYNMYIKEKVFEFKYIRDNDIKKNNLIEKLFSKYEVSYNYVLAPFEHLKKYIEKDMYNFIVGNKNVFSSCEKLKLGFPIDKDEFMYVRSILENGSDFYESIKGL